MLFAVISMVLLGVSPAQTAQEDSVLYLKFEKQSNEINRTQIGNPPSSYIYDYKMVYNGTDYKPISFVEPSLANIDTVSLEKTKTREIKSHEWLKQYFLEYFNHFKGENPYLNEDGTARFFKIEEVDQVVIVEIDEEKNRALLHYVVHQKY